MFPYKLHNLTIIWLSYICHKNTTTNRLVACFEKNLLISKTRVPLKWWLHVSVSNVDGVSFVRSHYSYVLFEFQFCKIQQTPQYYTLSFVKTRKTDLRLRAHIFYDDSASKSSYLSLFEIYIIYPRELVLMRTNFRENILKLYFISFSRELIFEKKPASHNSCELNFARKVPVAVTFRIRSKNGF